MSEEILRLENIKANYGDFPAVDDVSICIGEGDIVSVLGTNGSGKTTLMNCAAGLIRPSGGRIFLRGEDITEMPPELRVNAGLALVPQGGRCFARMSVEDNLLTGSYSRRARKQSRDSLEKVYSLFPVLKEKRKQQAGTLSGGERQMTAIGRAMMSRPSVMLFDELSLGLAPVVVKEIYARLTELNGSERMTIVLIEQDTRRAMRMSSYTYIMLKGRIVLEGRSDALKDEDVKTAYFGI
ncbi:MAG: ABC transporter ATP-binding protein [Lachnospiraceae bacterium]|nr:ABC transporter ATP-binding protein [Lachnospiraceae bacterium]